MAVETIADAPGRRERNKREKLQRIRRAARDVFLREGFADATVREIADNADVALGTLFLYAKDKRDLLLLLFDDELEALTERAAWRIDRKQPLVDRLIAFFTEFYLFFGRTPALSREMMREITFTDGMVARRIWTGVQGTEARIAAIIADAQADGVLALDAPRSLAAHVLFSLYRTEIRFCFAGERPDAAASLATLRSQFDLVCRNLEPTHALAPAKRRRALVR
jgi:AcrR family transcriptional regulator